MVQSVARVAIAGVTILSILTAPTFAAPADFEDSVLEAREFSETALPYVRRHFTKRELEEVELEARELTEGFELDAREPEPEPLHVPFFSNWNAGRKQRNQDRERGKAMRKQEQSLGDSGLSGREFIDVEFDLEARDFEDELEARDVEDELEARDVEDELEAREPEPEPLHIPLFSDWNAGRKQRKADRERGKAMRVKEQQQGAQAMGDSLGARSIDDEFELEAREPEPEPEPLHIPLFSDWNAGRKQRKADRERGKAMRVKDQQAGAQIMGDSVAARELSGDELEAREFFDFEIDELD